MRWETQSGVNRLLSLLQVSSGRERREGGRGGREGGQGEERGEGWEGDGRRKGEETEKRREGGGEGEGGVREREGGGRKGRREYRYRIRFINEIGNSEWSQQNIVSTTSKFREGGGGSIDTEYVS